MLAVFKLPRDLILGVDRASMKYKCREVIEQNAPVSIIIIIIIGSSPSCEEVTMKKQKR